MFRFAALGVVISVVSILLRGNCDSLDSAGSRVWFRPPGWVFAVMWPILYVTTGYAWEKGKRSLTADALFSCIVALLVAWLVAYQCGGHVGKMTAAVLCAAAAGIAVYLAFTASIWTAPLAGWLSFATLMNSYEAFILPPL